MKRDNEILYVDYAATTPTDKRVVDEMLPYFIEKFGNPASRTHYYGQESSDAIKIARQNVADILSVQKSEDIIFTSGATEAINLAILGLFEASNRNNFHLITCETEHKAVLDTCSFIEKKGAEVTYLKVDESGMINLNELDASFKSNTKLVCIMYVNNETGVLQPIDDITKITHEKNCLFFTDATQAFGKIEINVVNSKIDLLACSAHKIYGPNGIGALYINRSKIHKGIMNALIHGGGHEGGFRSGTLNTPAIVGFGKACEIAKNEMKLDYERMLLIRNSIVKALENLRGFKLNTKIEKSIPFILNFRIGEIDAEAIIILLKNKLALSNGSACTSKEIKPSHVLMAMFNDSNIAYASLRLSIGKYIKDEDIKIITNSIKEAIIELEAYQ